MSDTEFVDLGPHENCPDCHGAIWRPGPRGGVCQNIECVVCGSRFNILRRSREWDRRFNYDTTGPIVWAQRIPSERDGGSVWREDMFPKVLQ